MNTNRVLAVRAGGGQSYARPRGSVASWFGASRAFARRDGSRVLVIGPHPGPDLNETREGERWVVARCSGGPSPMGACPLVRIGDCPLAVRADVVVFALDMRMPLWGRTYSATQLLFAYRSHPIVGDTPMVLLAEAAPEGLPGRGPLEIVGANPTPEALREAVMKLVAGTLENPTHSSTQGLPAVLHRGETTGRMKP